MDVGYDLSTLRVLVLIIRTNTGYRSVVLRPLQGLCYVLRWPTPHPWQQSIRRMDVGYNLSTLRVLAPIIRTNTGYRSVVLRPLRGLCYVLRWPTPHPWQQSIRRMDVGYDLSTLRVLVLIIRTNTGYRSVVLRPLRGLSYVLRWPTPHPWQQSIRRMDVGYNLSTLRVLAPINMGYGIGMLNPKFGIR